MKTFFLLLSCLSLIPMLLIGCAPSAATIQQAIAQTQTAWTAVPSQTPLPTYTPQPTIEVTRIVVKAVTVTPTATPRYTATPSPTPTETPVPTEPVHATQTAEAKLLAEMTAPKPDGFYLVGVDMAPGTWRSTGSGDQCYWARTDQNQEILDNHFGRAGGAVTLRSSDFQFESDGCGTWVYLGR